MSTYEPMARIPESNQPYTEPVVMLNIGLTESTYRGLHALASWLDGFKAAGKADPPGCFELVMHFRELTDAINKAKAQLRQKCEHDWKDLELGKRWCPKCGHYDQRP